MAMIFPIVRPRFSKNCHSLCLVRVQFIPKTKGYGNLFSFHIVYSHERFYYSTEELEGKVVLFEKSLFHVKQAF